MNNTWDTDDRVDTNQVSGMKTMYSVDFKYKGW